MEPSPRELLERDGVCVLEGVIPAAEVAGVQEQVAESIRTHTRLPLPQGYVTGFLRVNHAVAPYMTNPRLLDLVRPYFGDHMRISSVTGVINGPGLPRGQWHADWPFNQTHRSRIPAPYPDLVMTLVTMWMLTDFTPDNGGTLYLPGSHKRSYSPITPRGSSEWSQPLDTERHLVGKAGDVGVFDARTWHAVAPNHTSAERIAVIVRYAPWWLNLNPLRPGTRDRRDIVGENATDSQVEPIPEAVYTRLPAALQPLVSHMVQEG
jgi:hypothetical protein